MEFVTENLFVTSFQSSALKQNLIIGTPKSFTTSNFTVLMCNFQYVLLGDSNYRVVLVYEGMIFFSVYHL